jgi:hypothetical protein
MRRVLALGSFCLLVLGASANGQEPRSADFPPDFGQRAMDHIAALVESAPRRAGSSAERDAAAYIKDQFETLGLVVGVEPFEFETFVIKQARLSACGAEASAAMVGFDPYRGELSFEGRLVFVRPDVGGSELGTLPLADALVVTADPAPFFALMFGRPRAVVYLDAKDYESVAASPCSLGTLHVIGEPAKGLSANLVATVGSVDPLAAEIVISAHYDSYRLSPGADDNASGVGVLTELARYFAARGIPPGLRLRFVAFGAEELGVLGSRCYLDAHREELGRCALLVNLDQVGGPGRPHVEMTGGVSGLPDTTVVNRFPADLRSRAWEAMDGRWRLLDPRVVERFMVSNRPPWLKDLIAESAAAIRCEIVPMGNMGGDQQVFTQAGVVATSIGTSGNTYHSPADTLGQVVPEQLAVVGRLAAEITLGAMERALQEDP